MDGQTVGCRWQDGEVAREPSGTQWNPGRDGSDGRDATEKEKKHFKFKTPLHFSEVLSTQTFHIIIIFFFALSYHITRFVLKHFFLGLVCNNLYSFACYRCNHFRFVVLLGFALYYYFIFFF